MKHRMGIRCKVETMKSYKICEIKLQEEKREKAILERKWIRTSQNNEKRIFLVGFLCFDKYHDQKQLG